MAFDYKKEYKEFYMPKTEPTIVTIPKMNYIAVRGQGDPNDEEGDYKAAIGLLYAIAYTAVYGLSMYFLGMNAEEKQLIMGPINKILRK